MNYQKPELRTLGDAKQIIEHVQRKPQSSAVDPHPHRSLFNPAYDLDE
jgi:hypothetical protein